jgi:hypothetical protein
MVKALYRQHPSVTPNRKHLARNYAQLLIELLESTNFTNQESARLVKTRLKVV